MTLKKSKISSPKNPHFLRFKIAIMGILASFISFLLGLIPGVRDIKVYLPVTWLIGFLILLPSLLLYYSIKERFWSHYKIGDLG